MTLGEYPQRVPAAYLIPLDRFRSKLDVGRFDNIATAAGLGVRGPRQAGGSIFDDRLNPPQATRLQPLPTLRAWAR
jgi:hypothetical protein